MATLTLHPPTPEDAEALFEAVRESIEPLHRWMPWCRRDYSLADAMQWASAQQAALAHGAAFEFLIRGADGGLLGCCGINQVQRSYRLANLGYWVRASAVGRGVASVAARLVARWAFAHTDLERLEILAAVGNHASQAVAVKAGAMREGVLRSRLLLQGRFHDAVVFSILRGDAAPSRASTPEEGAS